MSDNEYQFANFDETSTDSDNEEQAEEQQRRQYKFRQEISYNEPTDFHQRFRFTPRQVEILLQQLGDRLNFVVPTNHALTNQRKLLITLRFYASNDFFYTLGDTQDAGETTVRNVIKRTTLAIIDAFSANICWPNTEADCRRITGRFARLARPHAMPMVCGAVDGTLVDIVAPKDSGGVFVGRNRRTCLNVIDISDGGKKILFVSSKFPGAVHDQRVLRKTIGRKFDEGWRPFEHGILLGDSGYAATEWLIPMRENIQDPIKKLFYQAHARTRCNIEQLFGIFKNRFKCIKGAKGRGPLRFRNPSTSASVVMACACLQNFLVDNRTEEENDDPEYEDAIPEDEGAQAPVEEGEEQQGAIWRLNKQIQFFREFNAL